MPSTVIAKEVCMNELIGHLVELNPSDGRSEPVRQNALQELEVLGPILKEVDKLIPQNFVMPTTCDES